MELFIAVMCVITALAMMGGFFMGRCTRVSAPAAPAVPSDSVQAVPAAQTSRVSVPACPEYSIPLASPSCNQRKIHELIMMDLVIVKKEQAR
jgi:hypothetical protein